MFRCLWTFPTLSIWSELARPGPDMPLNRNATCLTGVLVCVSVPMRTFTTPGVGIDTSGTHGPTRAQGGRLGGPQGREVGGLVGLVWVGLGQDYVIPVLSRPYHIMCGIVHTGPGPARPGPGPAQPLRATGERVRRVGWLKQCPRGMMWSI